MPNPNPTTETSDLAALLDEANGVLDAGAGNALPPAPEDPGPFYAWEHVYQADDGNQYRRVIATDDDPQPTWAFLTPGGTRVCRLVSRSGLTFTTRKERDSALLN